jgi:RIO kinase 2
MVFLFKKYSHYTPPHSYDFLALRAFSCKGLVSGVGTRIGVGKESDVFLVQNQDGQELVLKLHRLGRTSFRQIKNMRDYHGKRGSPSWIYLSRIAGQKEFAFMKVSWMYCIALCAGYRFIVIDRVCLREVIRASDLL